MISLFHGSRPSQPVRDERNVLVNASQRRPQFVRDVRQQAVLEFHLFLPRHLQRAQQPLPLHCVADRAFQLLAGKSAFHQIILHAVVYRADGQRFVVLPREDNDRNVGGVRHDLAERFRTVTVGKVEIEQNQRRLLLGQRRQRVGEPVDAIDFRL